jgi:hypothetical protein
MNSMSDATSSADLEKSKEIRDSDNFERISSSGRGVLNQELELVPIRPNQLTELQKDLNGFLFLPSKKHVKVKLIYLTLIKAGSEQFPVTQEQTEAFRISKLADQKTSNWLCGGAVVYFAASALSCGTLGPGCIGPQWILNNIATVGNMISSGVSYLSTGTFPNAASVTANTKQNHYHEAESVYADIGIALIELAEDDQRLAKDIANQLQIDAITNAMKQVLSDDDIKVIVRPLKKARKFVLYGKIPVTPASIYNCIKTVLLNREVASLKRQLHQIRSISLRDDSSDTKPLRTKKIVLVDGEVKDKTK